MLVPAVLLVLALALLIWESISVQRSVSGLAARVHVNGTRGKSSVTSYIAAGLRVSGQRTWGKITGVIPTVIDETGAPMPIGRRGGPRVQEQFAIIRRAARHGIRNLVLECMSIQPELQRVESRHFRPHVYVLTNVRDDHREVFGADPEAQAEALCEAVPAGTLVLTAPGSHVPVLRRYTEAVGSSLRIVEPLPDLLVAQLPSGVFAANVALALAACEACGVTAETAFPAIVAEAGAAAPAATMNIDNGAVFVDGFAVNDVPSARTCLSHWLATNPSTSRLAIIFNARADRPLRSKAFAEYLPTVAGLDRIVLIGTHAPYMKRALIRAGYTAADITTWSRRELLRAREELVALGISSSHLVVGLGNIGGDGHLVMRALEREGAHAV